jgi:YVTN family beta-propeller protein
LSPLHRVVVSYILENPETNKVYVANYGSNTTSVIDSSNDTVVGNISNIKVGEEFPSDMAVEPEVV